MTIDPQPGDIWQFHRFEKVDPLTVLLVEEKLPVNKVRTFKIIPLDFPDLDIISFSQKEEQYWRKLA